MKINYVVAPGKKIKFENKENPIFPDLFVRPILTEKTTKEIENIGIYTFQVQNWANKRIVKSACEKLFNVEVVSVNIKNKKSIGKFVRGRVTKESGYKAAMIRIKDGQAINLAEVL